MKLYLYTICRYDIPLPQQAIQATHAGIEYARLFKIESSPSVIHLTVRDTLALEELRAELHRHGIHTAEFHESYQSWGLTAIACLLHGKQRELVRHLSLWKLPTQVTEGNARTIELAV